MTIKLELDEEGELDCVLQLLCYGVSQHGEVGHTQYAMRANSLAHVNRVGIVRKILARLGRELPPDVETAYQNFAPLLPPGCEGSLWNQAGGPGTPE